jgi:hypothetical protein
VIQSGPGYEREAGVGSRPEIALRGRHQGSDWDLLCHSTPNVYRYETLSIESGESGASSDPKESILGL